LMHLNSSATRPRRTLRLLAVFGHPFGACQVTFPSSVGAHWLYRGIDVQHQPGDLVPIGAFGLGVKEPYIGDEVFLVVGGQALGVRSDIGHRRIKRRLGHVAYCVPSE